jgi:cytohesin
LTVGISYTLTDSNEPPLSLQEGAAIGNVNLVNALLENGVGVESLDNDSLKTALHYAAIEGHKSIAELLLAKSAYVDSRDADCTTPLHYAAERGHKDIIELLIAKGADVNAKNHRGQTPFDIAINNSRTDIAELLMAKGATISSIHTAAQVGDLAAVKASLEGGTDINIRDNRGFTALHYAV